MADEKKKEPVKYKFGEQEFDLERYIKNIDANAASYMEKQNWNEGQKQEFMSAYNQLLGGLKDQLANNTNRFSTNSFGSILDSQGLLSNTDNDDIDPVGSEYYYDDKGNSITTDDYNTLKKRKQKNYQTFSANRAVATYFDKVGRKLLEKMETEAKPTTTTNENSFDFGKHGFVKWWGDKYNPGGGAFDGAAILELDQLVDGKRARTNRSARLAQDFTDYMGGLSDDLDFSKTRFKDKAGYTKFLNDVITKINDGAGLEENDLLDLSQAGVGRDFLEPFLSTDKTVTVSDADRAAEEAKKKADAEALQKKEREDAMRAFIENQQALAISNIGQYHDFIGAKTPKAYDTVQVPYSQEWYNPENGSFDRYKWEDSKGKDSKIEVMLPQFLANPFDTKWGYDRYVFLKTMLDSGQAIPITNNASLQGFYYIPRITDRAKATALVYNPSTQQMFETFIGNTSLWDSIMSDFKREKNWIDPASPYMRKEGGVLYMQDGGSAVQNAINYWYQQDREDLEQRAKKEGRTAKQQKAAERYINSDNASMANPDAGFTSIEIARLVSGAADIASTISAWLPGYGTAVSLGTGLGSTAGNLYADIMDDSVSAWDTVKNAGFNLGMDLVGLVPGGGSAGKFAKIGRNIINIAPKMIAALGTVSHITNAPEYIASWKKLGTDDKLDAQDWNNIMTSIQAVLGPAAGIGQYAKNKGYYGKNKAEAAKRVDTGTVNQDKVAVKMMDNTGKEKTVLFDGDDAVAIRKAQESGKIEDLKAATVDKFQDLDGWSLKETDFGFRRPQMSLNPTKWSPIGGKTVTPDDLIADVVTRQGVDFARVRGFHDDITSFHTPGRRWEDIDNAYIEAQLQPLASKSAAYDRMLRMKGKAVADFDSKIATADTNLANAKTSGSNKTSAELDAKLQQMRKDKADGIHTVKQDEITNSQTNLAIARKDMAKANRDIKKFKKMELAASNDTELTAIRNQIQDAKNDMDKASQRAKEAQDIIDKNTKWLADNDDSRVKALEDEYKNIKALEDTAQALKTDKAKWDKYTDTGKTKLREDFETNYPVDADGNITVQDPNTGRKITRNFKQILDKYSIKHKKGGILKAAYGTQIDVLEDDQKGSQENEKSPWYKGFLESVTNDTFLKYSVPRAWYADRMNRKITDMAIANERPFLQDPFQVHRTVKSDLDAEAWGQRAAAQMNNLTSNMQTSDFNAYQAARLEGATKGLDYIIQGNEKSNQAMKDSQELAWQQEKENAKSRHDIAQQNRLAMLQTMANKGKYEQAYQTKKHETWDTLWKEKQYKEEEEIKKNEAYADAFTKSEISDYVTSNLATLNPGLSEEGIKLYQQVKKGLVTPSSLSSDATKYQLFMEVADAASKLEQEEFRKYKGIPNSRWSKIRSITSGKTDDGITLVAKEGTKLKIQNSRVKTKNADRFAKQLKSDLDRNDKALARLSKSIYSYIKGQMV